jgi:uncharacterized protein (TIGR04255 family)
MYFNEPRVKYRNNQLGEVVCQLTFPQILTIEANVPADFQEAIREEFPIYSVRKEAPPPRLSGIPGNLQMEKQPLRQNHQFVSADGLWRVNLTKEFISLTCSRYSCWEDFAAKLDKPLAAFIRIYRPAFFQRIGLRYLNFFSRKALNLESTPFRELLEPQYLGILAFEDVARHADEYSSIFDNDFQPKFSTRHRAMDEHICDTGNNIIRVKHSRIHRNETQH